MLVDDEEADDVTKLDCVVPAAAAAAADVEAFAVAVVGADTGLDIVVGTDVEEEDVLLVSDIDMSSSLSLPSSDVSSIEVGEESEMGEAEASEAE